MLLLLHIFFYFVMRETLILSCPLSDNNQAAVNEAFNST